MPSYRVTMSIGALRPQVAAPEVLPTATAAAGEVAQVEASDLAVVQGQPRITVRFTADDAEIAGQVAAHVVASTSLKTSITGWRLTERVKGRWNAVPTADQVTSDRDSSDVGLQ